MPLIVNGIKSKTNDKGHVMRSHDFFFVMVSINSTKKCHDILGVS